MDIPSLTLTLLDHTTSMKRYPRVSQNLVPYVITTERSLSTFHVSTYYSLSGPACHAGRKRSGCTLVQAQPKLTPDQVKAR